MIRAEVLERHKNLNFPEFPSNDDFADWVERLRELDGYILGSAISKLNGERIPRDTTDFSRIRAQLQTFADLHEDRDIFSECREYLSSMEEIAKLI